MNTVKKTIHRFIKGDIVQAHGCRFIITENARPSTAHFTKDYATMDIMHEAPDCAVAESICIEGYIRGYIAVGEPWTFQGNFKAGEYTVEVQQ